MLDPLTYDEATGLPKLPDGYAWSVRENDWAVEANEWDKELIIQIAEGTSEKLSLWDRLIGKMAPVHWTCYGHKYYDVYEKSPNTAEGIKDAATKGYNNLRDTQLKSFERQKLVGLYPPKKL